MRFPSDLVAPIEVAIQLQRSVSTLERWRREQMGPPFLRVRGRVLYRRADLEAWLDAQRYATKEVA